MRHDLNSPTFPDHPVIVNLQSTGYPDGIVPDEYICPICDEECSFVYLDIDDNIVGCDCCIRVRCADDYEGLQKR